MPGRGLATTVAPAPCTPAPGPSSSAMAASCQAMKRHCAPCPASGPTPRARCGRSSTARRAFRSTATCCASWRACIGSRPLCPMPPATCAIWPAVSPCAHRSGEVAQALMDLGATVCRPRRPACLVCPWRPACQAHLAGIAEQLPRRAPRRERPVRRGLAFLLARPDGAILFRRRPAGGLLGGLHELPSSPWQEGPLEIERALAHAPSAAAWRVHPKPARHGFTHFVLELALAEARMDRARSADDASGEIWCPPAELDRLALPTVMKKLLRVARIAALDPVRAEANGLAVGQKEQACARASWLSAHRLSSCGIGGCCT